MLKWGLSGRGSNLLKSDRPLTSRTPGWYVPRVSSWDRRVGYSRSFTLRAARALKEKSFKRHLTNVQVKTLCYISLHHKIIQRREVSAHSTLSTAAAPKAAKPGNTRRQHAARAPPTRATDQIVLHAPGGPGDIRDRSDFYSRFDPRLERPHFSNVGPPTERRPDS